MTLIKYMMYFQSLSDGSPTQDTSIEVATTAEANSHVRIIIVNFIITSILMFDLHKYFLDSFTTNRIIF